MLCSGCEVHTLVNKFCPYPSCCYPSKYTVVTFVHRTFFLLSFFLVYDWIFSDEKSLQVLIREHSTVNLKSVDDGILKFVVRRNFLWMDTIRKLRRSTKGLNYPIRVDFLGESAIDAGGPRREFFSLLVSCAAKANVLIGIGGQYTFSHDIEKLESKEYYYFGQIIALSLLQGGSGPHCFCKPVAEYIAYEAIKSEGDVETIPDYEIREKLKQVL